MQSSLNELVDQLPSDERGYLEDQLRDVSVKAHEKQSYLHALDEVFSGTNFTRAASSRRITECSKENPSLGETNQRVTVQKAVQTEIINRFQRSAQASYERQNEIWKEIMAEIGIE